MDDSEMQELEVSAAKMSPFLSHSENVEVSLVSATKNDVQILSPRRVLGNMTNNNAEVTESAAKTPTAKTPTTAGKLASTPIAKTPKTVCKTPSSKHTISSLQIYEDAPAELTPQVIPTEVTVSTLNEEKTQPVANLTVVTDQIDCVAEKEISNEPKTEAKLVRSSSRSVKASTRMTPKTAPVVRRSNRRTSSADEENEVSEVQEAKEVVKISAVSEMIKEVPEIVEMPVVLHHQAPTEGEVQASVQVQAEVQVQVEAPIGIQAEAPGEASAHDEVEVNVSQRGAKTPSKASAKTPSKTPVRRSTRSRVSEAGAPNTVTPLRRSTRRTSVETQEDEAPVEEQVECTVEHIHEEAAIDEVHAEAALEVQSETDVKVQVDTVGEEAHALGAETVDSLLIVPESLADVEQQLELATDGNVEEELMMESPSEAVVQSEKEVIEVVVESPKQATVTWSETKEIEVMVAEEAPATLVPEYSTKESLAQNEGNAHVASYMVSPVASFNLQLAEEEEEESEEANQELAALLCPQTPGCAFLDLSDLEGTEDELEEESEFAQQLWAEAQEFKLKVQITEAELEETLVDELEVDTDKETELVVLEAPVTPDRQVEANTPAKAATPEKAKSPSIRELKKELKMLELTRRGRWMDAEENSKLKFETEATSASEAGAGGVVLSRVEMGGAEQTCEEEMRARQKEDRKQQRHKGKNMVKGMKARERAAQRVQHQQAPDQRVQLEETPEKTPEKMTISSTGNTRVMLRGTEIPSGAHLRFDQTTGISVKSPFHQAAPYFSPEKEELYNEECEETRWEFNENEDASPATTVVKSLPRRTPLKGLPGSDGDHLRFDENDVVVASPTNGSLRLRGVPTAVGTHLRI